VTGYWYECQFIYRKTWLQTSGRVQTPTLAMVVDRFKEIDEILAAILLTLYRDTLLS
jgi:DNA topoisomerase IA